MKPRRAAWLLAAVAAAGVSRAQGTDEAERGRAIYNYRCYFCHGYSGDAKTLAATYLIPPPRDFQSTAPAALPQARLLASIRDGVPGTSMKGFRGILSEAQVAEVAAFVRSEFLERRAPNTRYHTAANGWPGHDRYAAAFPFARGEIALDSDPRTLSPAQAEGRRLFMETCITCHDRARVERSGPVWQLR